MVRPRLEEKAAFPAQAGTGIVRAADGAALFIAADAALNERVRTGRNPSIGITQWRGWRPPHTEDFSGRDLSCGRAA